MALHCNEEQLPFTPPPYYVHKRDLPRSRGRQAAALDHVTAPSSGRTGLQMLRRISTRAPMESHEARVTKSRKKQRPGLSINTNVVVSTRIPREITRTQPDTSHHASNPSLVFQAPPNVTDSQPPLYTEQVKSHFSAVTNSPSRFPSTYLSTSRSSAQTRSSQVQDLLFAPPPRPSSSLYSRSARNSTNNRNSLRKFASRKATVRESNATAFEEDFAAPKRQRTLSNDTTFEEDEDTLKADSETMSTTTAHRSRGWWNVVTTPFVRTPSQARQPSQVDFTFKQESYEEVAYPAVPVPPIPGQYQSHTSKSHSVNSSVFSPSDQDIPIALGGDLMVAVPHHAALSHQPSVAASVAQEAPPAADTTSIHPRMPFIDVEKSPLSAARTEAFSPAGLEGGSGVVTSSRPELRPVVVDGQDQNRNSLVPEQGDSRNSARASFHAAVARTVRFITPRSSIYPPPPGQYTASREPFNPPPTPYYRKDSSTSFESFEYEDPKAVDHAKHKRASTCFSCCKGRKLSKQKTEKKDKKKMTRRRKCCFCCLCIIVMLLILLALIIVLAVMLSRKKGAAPSSQTIWVNTTQYPPLMTGTLTVARPNLVASQSGCVNPSTAWSCAVPKEQQAALAPNEPTQPNFIFNIRFDNSSGLIKRAASGSAVHAAHILKARAFAPSPPVPSLEEQRFLGNTTDRVVSPFEGESTPFYISFSEPGSSGSSAPSKVKRQAKPSQTVNDIPDIATNIPLPSLNPDNTPGPANLLPFPKDQPLRLYNRGRADEHYGFYTYFERNIFLRSNMVRNVTADIVSSDLNGGSTQVAANSRCTWKDTRFLVRIWTRRGSAQLLSKATKGSDLEGGDFKRPGTFSYPVTISLDRHGGGLNTKMMYCYLLDEKGRVRLDQRSFSFEDRSFNGTTINPSTGPFLTSIPTVSVAEGGPGGIDGGTGGCGCSWQNWS